jgi:hypothetical protein
VKPPLAGLFTILATELQQSPQLSEEGRDDGVQKKKEYAKY